MHCHDELLYLLLATDLTTLCNYKICRSYLIPSFLLKYLLQLKILSFVKSYKENISLT